MLQSSGPKGVADNHEMIVSTCALRLRVAAVRRSRHRRRWNALRLQHEPHHRLGQRLAPHSDSRIPPVPVTAHLIPRQNLSPPREKDTHQHRRLICIRDSGPVAECFQYAHETCEILVSFVVRGGVVVPSVDKHDHIDIALFRRADGLRFVDYVERLAELRIWFRSFLQVSDGPQLAHVVEFYIRQIETLRRAFAIECSNAFSGSCSIAAGSAGRLNHRWGLGWLNFIAPSISTIADTSRSEQAYHGKPGE